MTTTTEPSTSEAPAWLDGHEFPFDVRTARAGDYTLGYVDEGRGRTFLLLQAGQWSFVYRDVIPMLAARGRVVAVDIPGVGLSPDPVIEPTLDDLPGIIEALVEELGLSDFFIVTHDMAGIVGSALAARRPDLVAGIVYANSFGWDPDGRGLRTMLRLVSSGPARALARGTNWMLAVSASKGGAGRHWDPDTKRIFKAAGSTGPRRERSLRLMRQALRHPRVFDEIEAGRERTRAIPALTIFGERNDPFGFAGRHGANHDDVTDVVVEKGNHFPMADDPELFVRSVIDWANDRS